MKSETIARQSSFPVFIISTSLKKFKCFGPLALTIAVAAGLVARVWALGAHSLLQDEASVALGARDILRNHTAIWDADSNAPFVWLVAHLVGLRGLAHPFLLRLPAAIFGTASIFAVYWLAARLFNVRIAGITALLFAIHPFAVAFNRVLFADTFQLFFILLGIIAFDYYAVDISRISSSAGSIAGNASLIVPRSVFRIKIGYRRGRRRYGMPRWMILSMVFLLWGAAFLMKYNAVVPGALWLVAGVAARRYSIGRAFLCFLAMAFGSLATLLPWPYNASIWLFSFVGKGGSYDIAGAFHYFWTKLHLLLFGVTEITLAAGVVMSFVLRGERRKSIAQTTLFILLYLVTISILGRTFERYLLMMVPFACLLIVAIASSLVHSRKGAMPSFRIAGIAAVVIAFVIFGWGLADSYSNYFAYLHNDYDHAQLAKEALALELSQAGTTAPRVGQSFQPAAFWLLPEPIGAYYLGFSQFYSRAVHPCLDGPLAFRNYFEWASVPYCRDLNGLGILAIRRMARRWGFARILRSPFHFKDSAEAISRAMHGLPRPPAVDYLTSDFIHPGDLLIMQCGMTDLQEEPILENISHENGPPLLKTLPLSRFQVLCVYRPHGQSAITDTILTRVRAGAWLMIRKK